MSTMSEEARERWEAIIRSWEAAVARPCMRRWRSLAEMITHAADLDDDPGLRDLAAEAWRRVQ